MQYSTLLLAAILPALGLAAPAGQSIKASSSKSSGGASATGAPPSNVGGGSGKGRNGVSDTQLLNAVNGWQNDTGKVTNFLNTATSLTGDSYTVAATIALNAEKDELNHKAVLDAGLDPATIQSANDTLATKGTFQAVVDALQAMVNEGPETAQQRVTEINNNRCVNVLPNINAYMAAAGQPMSSAIVPTGCLEVAATNPGSVVPSGAPLPGGNNNGTLSSITSAPVSTSTSASSSSSSSSTTTGNNGNGNGNGNGNAGGNGNSQTTTTSSSGDATAQSTSTTSTRSVNNNNNKAKATTTSSTSTRSVNNAKAKATTTATTTTTKRN